MALTVAELEAVVGVDTTPMEGGLSKMLGKVKGFGSKAGLALGGIGAAGGALFAAGVASAMNLEDVRARFQAELGLTSGEAARMGNIAGRVYAGKFGSSLEEVSSAMTTVVSSIRGMKNASNAEIQDMTEKALTFADVFQVDVARATQVAGGAVKSGLAKNATEAFDLLTTTMQKVPVQVREDVLDATDEYGQFFTSLGIGGEQAFGLLAKSASKGMFGIDKTGDALKEFTIRSTDMSAASKAGYDAIGLSQEDMTRKILKGGDGAGKAFDTIVDGLVGIKDPAKQSQAALALFGPPLEDLGVKDMPKFLRGLQDGKKGLGDFKGSTNDMVDAMGNTASAKLGSFFRTIKQQTIGVLGKTVLPWVQKFAGDMTKTLTPMVKKAGPIVKQVSQDIARFAEDMAKKAGPIITQVKGVLTDLFREGGKGRKIFTDLAAKVSQTWLQIVDTVGPVIEAIRAFFNSPLGGAMVDGIVNSVNNILNVIGGLLRVVKGLAQFITGVFTGDWSKAWEGIKNIVGGAGKIIGSILRSFWNMIKIGFGAVFAVVRGIVGKAWGGIKGLMAKGAIALVGLIKSLPGRARAGLSGMVGAITQPVRDGFNGALGLARSLGGQVVGWVTGIPAKLRALGGKFANAGKAILQKFIDGMKNAAGIISGIAGNVWDSVKGLINGAIDKINGALQFTIDLPGPKNLHVDIANIPHLATGGRATSDTLAVIGDGNEPESVLPDSMLRGLLERAHDAGAASRQDRGRGSLMGDAYFQVRDQATARELVNELTHAMRVADFGGVFA